MSEVKNIGIEKFDVYLDTNTGQLIHIETDLYRRVDNESDISDYPE